MNRFAIALAAIALTAGPSVAQNIYPPNSGPCAYPPAVGPYACNSFYGYGSPYAYAAPYGGAYAYAPGGAYAQYNQFYGSGYTREGDIATEPDPNVRLELRREENLNEGMYNY